MKLSSPDTRWAFTSVIAAAIKYGPTRVNRIASDLDIPVETCRYYLKKFHEAGFRFLPVVDYRAIGLSPHMVFVRFSRQINESIRNTVVNWLDRVYTVYRASLQNSGEFFFQTVPPEDDKDNYIRLFEFLQDAGVFENCLVEEIVDGYYKPEWISMYSFDQTRWDRKMQLIVPTIPYSETNARTFFDKLDLAILEELELNPRIKMKEISKNCNVSPQLISYHREKHVEAGRLVTGYVPVRQTHHEDVKYMLVSLPNSTNEFYEDFLHSVSISRKRALVRLHMPPWLEPAEKAEMHIINPYEVRRYAVPVELQLEIGWTGVAEFIAEAEKMLKTIRV